MEGHPLKAIVCSSKAIRFFALLLSAAIFSSSLAFADNGKGNNGNGNGNGGGSGSGNAGGVGNGNANGASNGNSSHDTNQGKSPQSPTQSPTVSSAPIDLGPGNSFSNATTGKLKDYYVAEVEFVAAQTAQKRAVTALDNATKSLASLQIAAKSRAADPAIAQQLKNAQVSYDTANDALKSCQEKTDSAKVVADAKLAEAIEKPMSPQRRAWLDMRLTILFHEK